MDNMYSTVQVACRMAIKAHNREKRVHVVFFEMGLFRIKPVEEILEIDEKRVYGWTVAKWYCDDLHPEMKWEDVKKQFPMGDDSFIRKQFYKGDCYFSSNTFGIKTYNRYTRNEIVNCILNGQNFK